MTAKARKVLADCSFALEQLENETTDQSWRVHWIACIVLLRTVGDVLEKVDGKRDPIVKRVQKNHFGSWMDLPEGTSIFRDFIRMERNLIVHEYASTVHNTTEINLIVSREDSHEIFELDENLFRPLIDRPWAGEDARDMIQTAIDWWSAELNAIDIEADLLRS